MQKVYNEFGEFISSIFSFDFNEINFIYPHFIVDVLEPKDKPPKLRRETDSAILNEIDFTLYMKTINRKTAWLRWQKFMLILKPTEDAKEPGFRKIKKLPAEHEFEIDEANHRIRLIGPFVTKTGYGDWINY
jgi:hypothetical protein